MRTLDPEIWYRNVNKAPLDAVRAVEAGRTPTRSNSEMRLRSSFRDAMKEYFSNCSIKGLKCVTDRSDPKLIRWCYVSVAVAAITTNVLVVVHDILRSHSQQKLSVSPQFQYSPLSEIDFPAVGLCSTNRISRASCEAYASHLYSLDKNKTFTLDEIKANLLSFLGVINRSVLNYNRRFLNYLKETIGEKNVTAILYKLSPTCERLLVRCSWGARRRNCSELFAMRITEFGFCCIFNSRYLAIDEHNPVFRTSHTGPDEGLQVVLRDDSQDFVQIVRPSNVVQIVLFDGTQHPLLHAGVIRVYSSSRNASVFLSLSARIRLVDPELAEYEESWLGCGFRSWSLCVSRCRAHMLQALCLCSPLGASAPVICSLEHLECLAKYREKLMYFYPGEEVHDSLREEQANAVHCDHCIPNCIARHYSADMDVVPYGDHTHQFHRDTFMQGLSLVNTSVVRIYFRKTQQEIQMLEVNQRWYESLISLSSLLMSVAGVSAVSVTELCFHLTARWRRAHRARWTTPTPHSVTYY